jgi:guanylate kinase
MMSSEDLAGGPALLVVLSAPSGGGKTTLCQNMLAADARLTRVVTCTTRRARGGERDGVDYHFLKEADFERRVSAGEFLEHAEVHGQRYGTLRREVTDRLTQRRDVLLSIDVQGAASVRLRAAEDPALGRALVTVFLTPSGPGVLEQRLRGRGTEDEASVARRMAAARGEVDRWAEFDYLLVSATMEEDVRRLRVILEAERMRTFRSGAPWRA